MKKRARFEPNAVWSFVWKRIRNGDDRDDVLWDLICGFCDMTDRHVTECEQLETANRTLSRMVAQAKDETKIAKGWGYVYLMKGDNYYKIGMSKRPPQRTFDISPKMPFDIQLVCVIESDNARKLEMELHQKFSGCHLRGEWFALGPGDIEYIKELKQ